MQTPAEGVGRQTWSSGICDCAEDPLLCCTVCVCSCNATGQVYQRLTGRANACILISLFGWFVFFFTTIASQISNAMYRTAVERECTWWYCTDVIDWDQIGVASIVGGVGAMVGFAGTIVTTYAICVARARIRDRDRIPFLHCGQWEDCCLSYWCSLCSLVQIIRHERIDGGSYRPCSTTAV